MIDEKLLDQARAAITRLEAAEREVVTARTEYHAALRRLHVAGNEPHEIASMLKLSHQWVRRIIESAGETWLENVRRSRNAKRNLACTFCGLPFTEVAEMIDGPGVAICDGCVVRAGAKLAGWGRRGESLREADHQAEVHCSFCGKKASDARLVLGKGASVCVECLTHCQDIVNEEAYSR